LIRESNLRALPVVDAENRCVGVLSGWKVSNYLFPSSDEALGLGLLVAAIGDIVNSFNGEYLAGEPDSNRRRLVIVVGAMSLESLLPPLEKRRLGRGRPFCWGQGRCSVSCDRCRSLGSCHHRGDERFGQGPGRCPGGRHALGFKPVRYGDVCDALTWRGAG
jgi:CBS domain-containing protein